MSTAQLKLRIAQARDVSVHEKAWSLQACEGMQGAGRMCSAGVSSHWKLVPSTPSGANVLFIPP